MQALDEPIIGIILADTQYHRYLNIWWILANVQTANQKARSVFRSDDTPRKVWNALMLQRPCFCWKIHESKNSEINVGQCTTQNNPVCGHPEETQFFHGLWVASYLANQIDRNLPHPRAVIYPLIHVDFAAQVGYWTDIFSTLWGNPMAAIDLLEEEEIDEQTAYELTWGVPANISAVKKTLQARERRLWEEVIRPHMMRVSDILRAA